MSIFNQAPMDLDQAASTLNLQGITYAKFGLPKPRQSQKGKLKRVLEGWILVEGLGRRGPPQTIKADHY